MEPVHLAGVIFDWNGVLALDEAAHYSAFVRLSKQTRRVTLTPEQYEHHCRGKTDEEGIELLLKHDLVAGELSDLVAFKQQLYRASASAGAGLLADGAIRVLDALNGEVPYRVVSASPREEIDLIRTAAAIVELLPEHLIESDVTSANRRDALQRAAAMMAIPTDKMLLVDDSEHNITLGRQLRMTTARVSNHSAESHTDADYFIQGIGGVIEILNRHGHSIGSVEAD